MLKNLLFIILYLMVFSVAFSQGSLTLKHLSTHFTDVFDEGAAEIATYDAGSKRLFYTNANANSIGVLDITNPASIVSVDTLSMAAYGAGVTSVDAYNGVVAAAVFAAAVDGKGKVLFIQASNGNILKEVEVGFLPDMLTFTHDGSKLLVANEGQPNDDYTIDPVGSVSIIDLSNGVANASVTDVTFEAFNDKKAYIINKGIRIFGPNASVAQDLEPEYITIISDNSKAYVSMQENNALAVIDIAQAKVLDLLPLGFKDHSKGQPTLKQFFLNELVPDWPTLGTPGYGGGQDPVLLGGFSGMYYDAAQSTADKYVFYLIPDRGPNDEAITRTTVTPVAPQSLRPYKLPNFQTRFVKISLDVPTGKVSLDEQILLKQADGTPLTGKGNVPGKDEVPVTYSDPNTPFGDTSFLGNNGVAYHLLEYDQFSGDLEGIFRDKQGNFWTGDENRPAIDRYSPGGVLLNRYIPQGTKAQVLTEGIFFSEYGEGTSNNKYLEIFNAGKQPVNLSDYLLVNCSNGCESEGVFEFDNSAVWQNKTLASGDVFVIAHPSAQPNILAKADTTFTFLSNGNDWYAILKKADSTLVDQIGLPVSAAPAGGWDVAGVTEATKDRTMIRKHYILKGNTDWQASAGQDSVRSEWLVKAQPTIDYVSPTLGTHMEYGEETLPPVYIKRWSNRGFEAIAYDSLNNIVYAFIQSPIENPNNSVRNKTDVLRILGISAEDGTPVNEYVYLLDRNKEAGFSLDRVDKIGDAVYTGNGKFLVLERDSGTPSQGRVAQKFVFEIDITHATNILGTDLSNKTTSSGANDKTLEMMSADDLAAAGIRPAFKHKVLNLPSLGYTPSDKAEGITLLPDGSIAVINDNDFGIAGAGVSDISSLGIITFGNNNGLDASDRDNAVNIARHPVLGMYMPDAIASFTFEGRTFIATANEGDSRDYDGFSEESRVSGITLDTTVFPNAAALQGNAVLGRLTVTKATGDIDDDTDHDRIYAFGSRSFSIFDEYGNLVYDSGDDFEQITSALFPADFNSDNAENGSFDNRSDNKGVEPEAIAVINYKDRVYALIGFERLGGVMMYDITYPYAPFYVSYTSTRDFMAEVTSRAAGDLGVEGITYIPAEESPNGMALVVTSNEVSGTVSIFTLDEVVGTKNRNEQAIQWSVFPNPAGSDLYTTHISDFVVFNMMGQRQMTASQTNHIQIGNLPAGIYVVTDMQLGVSKTFVKK